MRVIGTAGHVDHGKSTLIAALTGIHPDRLKEEQEREMTIELGFGWMSLPNGEELGIVDVPGHRDFIENMLAGIGGIDAALLIIAADEGIMPQTKEHLAILDLLQIPGGLIVLTKIDLASDSTWLDLVETDIRSAVANTPLHDSPIIRVSAKNKIGLDDLTSALEALLQQKPERPNMNRPRLPVDRVFSMSGFGTVITGTLSDGSFSTGDEVEILPEGFRGRIRGLQTHRKKEETAIPGSRTAVNITGIDMESIRRGDVLAHPDQYTPTRRLDAHIRILKDASTALKHNTEVKFFTGASETIATARILGVEEILPGDEGWVQFELRNPLVVVRKDRFIIRRPSPGETLGGGMIMDAHPKDRHKRSDKAVIKSLSALAQGSPAEILYEASLALPFANVKEVIQKSHLDQNVAEQSLQELEQSGQIVFLEENLVGALPHWVDLKKRISATVDSYHVQYPLRRGIPREELKSKLKINPRVFNASIKKMVREKTLDESKVAVFRPGFEIGFGAKEQAAVDGLRRRFSSSPYTTPSIKECIVEIGEESFNALLETGELISVSADVIFEKNTYEEMIGKIRVELNQNGQITLGNVRDLFNTSRKYAQALLEHLDALGITVRDGDVRRLGK